jgi:LemA protein
LATYQVSGVSTYESKWHRLLRGYCWINKHIQCKKTVQLADIVSFSVKISKVVRKGTRIMTVGGALLLIFGFIVFLCIAIIIWAVLIYNRLVSSREFVNEGWSLIDVQLKRRFNLIKNLVNIVKGYASHEVETLEKLTDARSAAYTDDPKERAAAEGAIGSALVNMLSVTEAYPDLKADGSFRDLQQELSQLEDVIQKSRRYYNGNVRNYNTSVQTFPDLIIANLFAFREAAFFELDNEDERKLTEVSFGETR